MSRSSAALGLQAQAQAPTQRQHSLRSHASRGSVEGSAREEADIANDGSGSTEPVTGLTAWASNNQGGSEMLSTGGSSALGVSKPTPRLAHHRSYYAISPTSKDVPQYPSERVREQTAELANYALSDAASSLHSSSPPISQAPSTSIGDAIAGTKRDEEQSRDLSRRRRSSHPEMITELSEPGSPDWAQVSPPPSAGASALTQLLRSSPPEPSKDDDIPTAASTPKPLPKQYVRNEYVEGRQASPPNERTQLLSDDQSKPSYDSSDSDIGDLDDPERHVLQGKKSNFLQRPRWHGHEWLSRHIGSTKSWNRHKLWKEALVKPVSYVPAVLLGLLLNILDALSYGLILFPLGQPIFSSLGPDGISMFYVSCIVSQLVYSCGGSIFRGGIGSEMIEVVPFFHKMAFTILADIGEENQKSVLATTVLSYSLSSILTGIIFFSMGACRLGSLIGFFPRHILIGCIGGVGWFLIATGFEVAARLDHLEYDMPTLQKLFQPERIPQWMIPLVLAIGQIICRRWVKHQLFFTLYFLAIPALFYFFVAALPNLDLDDLRSKGWIFEAPQAGVPFYHFYTLYDFNAVDWAVLAKTIPAMFALTFFGILHVPINVPALGVSTGEDNVNVDRELIAHGVSNAISGFAGSIQNYLVYSNSILFIRNGGESRVAGVMLAFGTFGILVAGPAIIGFIPVMIVGALIFLLGIELLGEALQNTWGKLNKLEYLTVVAIVVIMGVWDFVIGILAGILLACLQFVVQTSRKSAIRATYTGIIATSTVRRHPIQYRFLREVGQQTHIAKLTGYLFFGTIVNVEKRIRALLDEEAFSKRPIRFLIMDLSHVTGIDFSAAEAFTRINRILSAKSVHMIVCGASREGEIYRSLQGNGLWDEGSEVMMFEDLNSALEHCENELLKAFYSRRDALARGQSKILDVPQPSSNYLSIPYSQETFFSSPRRSHLHRAATATLDDAGPTSASISNSTGASSFKQPLPLMLQSFQDLTSHSEDFWFRACPFFLRREYVSGTVLYHAGDNPDGFYLLEQGILRAEYASPQGSYYESIVAGTTCGELPFFSDTERTATVSAERDCVAWLLDETNWTKLQRAHPDVANELLRVSLKLTSERMSAITSYVLTTAG